MASLPPSLRDTLTYFDKYDYPLTLDEIKYWSPVTHPLSFPLSLIKRGDRGEFYFLPGRSHLVKLRKQRERFSKKKWLIAKQVGDQLKKFPSIAAIFVTGALAMNNCPKNDDIDLMIITKPNTLWLTRFFIDIYLKLSKLRRLPNTEHRTLNTSNLICDNLWLDTKNLVMHTHTIYLAHEILQAKCIFDREGVHYQFLKQNSWVKKYLPIAYTHSIKKTEYRISNIEYLIFWPLNLLFFLIQYLYMLPKMTSEKVGLGFAFFHPSKLAFPRSS